MHVAIKNHKSPSKARIMRLVLGAFFISITGLNASAQNIPQALEYTEIYDFIEELATDGVIEVQTAVKPYSRRVIAGWLAEAAGKDSLLNRRQRQDLDFYLQDFALELDTMPDYRLYGHNNVCQWTKLPKGKVAKCDFNLSLVEPALHLKTKDNNFKMMVKPILGMDIYASKKGMITKRWYGAEVQMDIVHHVSIWGSLRDNSWKGTGYLNETYFPGVYAQIDGAKLTKGQYLNNLPGVQYKESNYGGDYSDSRGGVSVYAWWGSIGIQRERVQWGDAQHCSNIISGRTPAVPMLTMQLTPCKWFQFDYFHAWLTSNVLDSTSYFDERYDEGVTKRHYRPANKFMAANMFTFMPVKYVSFSFGNSIVYSEKNPQAAYFIPIAFYKSLDHLMTKGLSVENQNSQAFATLTVRPVDHLRLYGSFYLDEFKLARLKKSNAQHNPISYLVGFNWSGWPVKGLSLKGEFMRSYQATYTHSIDVLTYRSNSYAIGHYMNDNAQSIFTELEYRPVRGLSLRLNYTCDTKYQVYDYVRHNIKNIISYKPFDQRVWQNDQAGFRATYEIFQNCYAVVDLTYNNARGFDVSKDGTVDRVYGEDRGWNADGSSKELTGDALAQYYLDTFTPLYYQGKNLTFMCGLSFSF